nr:hypothetical protein [uncultured Roseibium sp.]
MNEPTKERTSYSARVAIKVFPWMILAALPFFIWWFFLGSFRIGMAVWIVLGLIIPGIIALATTRKE